MKKADEFTYREIKKLLNKMLDARTILNSNGYSIPLSGNVKCPFHENFDTPAAKYYSDTHSIYCFAEHRNFYAVDALQLIGANPKEVFKNMWESYSEAKQQDLLDNLDTTTYETKVLFKESLAGFKAGVFSYSDLCADIVSKLSQHTAVLRLLYNISREINEVYIGSDDYTYLSCLSNLNNIKQITFGEIIKYQSEFRGYKFIINFIQQHEDVVLIFNMYKDTPIGCTIRSKKTHAFADVGNTGGVFYNICNMSRNFRYGDPIVIVEGPKDCETYKKMFDDKNCLALMTSNVSSTQLEVLKGLTNNIIWAGDNDKAGIEAKNEFIKWNNKNFRINELCHPEGIKDFGDLLTYAREDKQTLKSLLARYKVQLRNTM